MKDDTIPSPPHNPDGYLHEPASRLVVAANSDSERPPQHVVLSQEVRRAPPGNAVPDQSVNSYIERDSLRAVAGSTHSKSDTDSSSPSASSEGEDGVIPSASTARAIDSGMLPNATRNEESLDEGSDVSSSSTSSRNSAGLEGEMPPDSVHLSVGSALHSLGKCKPCFFVHTKIGCQNGARCQFCHYQHKDMSRPSKGKGKKDMHRKFMERMQDLIDTNPDILDEEQLEMPPSIGAYPELKVSLMKKLKLYAEQVRVSQRGQASSSRSGATSSASSSKPSSSKAFKESL